MPRTERIAPTASTWRGPVYGTSLMRPEPSTTIAMIKSSSRKPTRHERKVRDESTEQRSDRRRDRRRGSDQGIDPLLGGTFEVAVDQGLHRRHHERCAEPTDHGPEHDDRGDALGERHRQRAGGVPQETDHIRALPADQVADLAADQDEGRRHERLERDRRLDAADRGIEVMNHGRDRHVHQRRVEHEHEHRHREQEGESPIERGGSLGGGFESFPLSPEILRSHGAVSPSAAAHERGGTVSERDGARQSRASHEKRARRMQRCILSQIPPSFGEGQPACSYRPERPAIDIARIASLMRSTTTCSSFP